MILFLRSNDKICRIGSLEASTVKLSGDLRLEAYLFKG